MASQKHEYAKGTEDLLIPRLLWFSESHWQVSGTQNTWMLTTVKEYKSSFCGLIIFFLIFIFHCLSYQFVKYGKQY